jgi:MFS family permease
MGFCLGLAGQGVAICATTILQQQADDDYRGRMFAFYDMTFNVTYAGGAALSVLFMSVTGHSPVLVAIAAIGFAVTAIGYWLATRVQPSAGGEMPSAAAQRRSS